MPKLPRNKPPEQRGRRDLCCPIRWEDIGAGDGIRRIARRQQWSFFRNRLQLWWVAVNAVIGIGLGSLHKYLFEYAGWGTEDLRIFLAMWIVVNFVLGLILLRKAPERSRDLSPIVETGARQNIFLALISAALILGSLSNISLMLSLYSLQTAARILYGIAAVLAGISIILKKEIPRNFGFIVGAVFLFLDGINVVRVTANPDAYPLYYFTLSGIFALTSGAFFISQRETWKNFGFIMLSGCLLVTGAASMFVYETDINRVFLAISIYSLPSLPQSSFFFVRTSPPRGRPAPRLSAP